NFKNKLAKKIQMSYEKSISDSSYSTFLGNFGEFKVPVLNKKNVTEPQEIILSELNSIKEVISNLKKDAVLKSSTPIRIDRNGKKVINNRLHDPSIETIFETIKLYFNVNNDYR